MFDDSNPPSPSRGTSAMSPLIKDAVKDIDWNSPQTLPTPTKPDPRESPWLALSLIVPGLYLTCERTTEERMRLVVMGCRLVVKMNADVDEAPFNIYAYDDDAATQVMKAVDEETFIKRLVAECTTLDSDRALLMEPLFIRSVVADDSPVFDIAAYFEELCSLIELVLSRRKLLETEYSDAAKSGADVRLPNVVVHCKAGVSRSAAIVIAYMMKKYHISRAHALQYVQDARPVASPNHGFVAQLTLWESTR
ncbi:dual specificity protein phosphatase, putative, partial [Bodo saltans]